MWSLTVALVLFVASNHTVGMVPTEVTYFHLSLETCLKLREAYYQRPLNNAWVIGQGTDCEREADGRER